MFTVFETWSLRLLLEKTVKAISYMPNSRLQGDTICFFQPRMFLL
jgi:hypothetical protein